jgi:hypothetical protein
MSRYELTVDSNYVKDWGIPQAIRELFQNAYDAEVEDKTNTAFCNYFSERQTIEIGNKKSVLNIESLLLGCTSKSGNADTIGQFGEGYKLATLVLLRNGKKVTFYNYGAREVWNTKLIKSRRYNGRLVPIFDVDKKFVWQKVPHSNLIVEIEGISEEEYTNIKRYILPLNDKGEILHSDMLGDILLDEKYKGDVYSNGLLICHNDSLHCGYDIPPRFLALERDRHTVADFDLLWATSRLWCQFTNYPKFEEILSSEDPYDVRYIYNWSCRNEDMLTVYRNKYGKDAIPVSNQSEYDFVKKHGGKPVIVNDTVKKTYSYLYEDFSDSLVGSGTETCYNALTKWFDDLCDSTPISQDVSDRFYHILEVYEDILRGDSNNEETESEL